MFQTQQAADIVLPGTAWVEKDAAYVNERLAVLSANEDLSRYVL